MSGYSSIASELNTPGIAFTPLPTLCHGRILGWFAKVVLPEMYHFMG